jgi:predicted transposase YdaD
MSLPFDATFKEMLERSPADWLALAGLEGPGAELIDADVSTVTAAADKVLRVPQPSPWIAHVEAQSGPDAAKPRLMHLYNAALEVRHDLPVASVLLLLAPRANLSTYTGEYRSAVPGQEPHVVFRYRVVRVWELPVDPLLTGGLGTLPLAPIASVEREQVPAVIERMRRRLSGELEPSRVRQLWSATFILMGLRYDEPLIGQLLREVEGMEESVTYQAIIRKGVERGRVEEARRMLVLMATGRFGEPPPQVLAALNAITDLDRLEGLGARLLLVNGWEELLAPAPAPSTPRRRRRSS